MLAEIATEEGTVEGDGGVSLWWKSYTPTVFRARVCLAHGAADHSSRHLDTITHLTSLGFAVDTFDFRGHGRSGGPRGHVDRFDEYVADLRLFIDRSRARAERKQRDGSSKPLALPTRRWLPSPVLATSS